MKKIPNARNYLFKGVGKAEQQQSEEASHLGGRRVLHHRANTQELITTDKVSTSSAHELDQLQMTFGSPFNVHSPTRLLSSPVKGSSSPRICSKQSSVERRELFLEDQEEFNLRISADGNSEHSENTQSS